MWLWRSETKFSPSKISIESTSNSEAGSALIEFSFCLSFLVILTFGVAMLGLSLRERADVIQIAGAAARAAANQSLGGTPESRAYSMALSGFTARGVKTSDYKIGVARTEIAGRDAIYVRLIPKSKGKFSIVNIFKKNNAAKATFVIS